MFFNKPLTLRRVRDTVAVREGDETLTLRVDKDAFALVTEITAANRLLSAITADSTDDERLAAARALAAAIFGSAQADRLEAFYNGDAGCVASICGMYFAQRLGKKITRAQKK